MDKESKTNLITAIILIGFVASVFFHYVKSAYWGLSYPHNTFLFIPIDRFNDFYSLLKWNYDLNPYLRGVATPQYPLLNFISYLFTFLHPLASFALFNFIIIASFIYFNAAKALENSPEKGILKAWAFELFWLKSKFNFYKGVSIEEEQRIKLIEDHYWKEIDSIL